MTGWFTSLLARYRDRGLLIDTNLLLLLIVGLMDRNAVGQFKRTGQYSVDDFDLLVRLVALFDRLVVTPQVLAELSDLIPSDGSGGLHVNCVSRMVAALR